MTLALNRLVQPQAVPVPFVSMPVLNNHTPSRLGLRPINAADNDPRRRRHHCCSDPKHTSLKMSNDAPKPISDDEVVALAQQILRQSRVDIDQRAEQTPREVQQQQPGITIDLGHKNIVRLPDEVINVIRAEIER